MTNSRKINTRFGEVEYDPDQTVHFPEGLIGLEGLRDFIVMPNKKEGPLFWIQSVDDPQIAFVLTDPNNFFLDYRVEPDQNVRKLLEIDKGDACHALSLVTVPPDQKITFNLAAPILFAPKNNKAVQVILENSPYQTKTPLPSP